VDGDITFATLMGVKGTLSGTPLNGGTFDNGTVFALRP